MGAKFVAWAQKVLDLRYTKADQSVIMRIASLFPDLYIGINLTTAACRAILTVGVQQHLHPGPTNGFASLLCSASCKLRKCQT